MSIFRRFGPQPADISRTNVNLGKSLLPTISLKHAVAERRTPLRVTLINPPSVVSRFATVAELVPPLGVAYVAATLRQAGHEVQLIDAVGEKPTRPLACGNKMVWRGLPCEDVVERVDRRAEIIGVSGMFSSQWPHYKRLIRGLREAFPQARIVGGGEHFTAMPEFCLETCRELDLCVLGEGESPMLELVAAISRGDALDRVTGIAYRRHGQVVVSARTGRIFDVDDIPLPAWDLVPLENYLSHGLGWGVGKRRAMPMIATRGCPFQCTFCSSPFMWTTRWIPRNPERVLDEIELYQRQYGAQEVQFYDLTAVIKKEWILQFCRGLVQRGISIVWQLPIGTRSEAVDEEVADHLYRSGCSNMGFAPESGSPTTLKRIKKMVDLGHMKKSIRACVQQGLNVKANIILGFPKQTHWETWESFKFAVELSWLGVHDISFFPFSPYPGTELFDDLRKEGRLPEFTDDWFSSLSYVELGNCRSYCENIGPWMLRFYQLLGFALFYATQYLFRPWRLARSVRNLLRGEHESKGEQAVASMVRRVLLRAG